MSRLVLAVVVAVALPACGSDPAPPTSAYAKPVDWSSLDPGWSTLEPPPFARARAVSVWTGTDLFLWGGDTDFAGTAHADGTTLDPSSGRWKPVPASPIGGRSSAAAAWTGKEVLVWGGWDSRGPVGDGAAYEPVDRTWRVLPDAPLGSRDPAASVWTGTELIVWGDASRSAKVVDGAAYDPTANEWRTLPPAPFALNQASAVWTGREMIVFGAFLDGNNASGTKHARGLAYDPEVNSWRAIAPYPLSPQASSVVWTGVQMLAWDYELRAATYEPDSDTWSPAPDVPLGFFECYPQGARVGSFVLAYHCGSAALFDLEAREWRVVPGRTAIYGPPVSAGKAVLFAGAAHEGGANAVWVYKPAPDGPSGFVPRTERRGKRTLMPLTFPDGTSVVLSYAEWLRLAELGVQPDVSYLHRDDPAPRFQLGFYFGHLPAGAGSVVAQVESWTITAPGREEAEVELLRSKLRVRATTDGFVALDAHPPVGLAQEFGEGGGPQLALGDLNPSPKHTSLDPLILLAPVDCGSRTSEVGKGYGSTCLDDRIHVGVYGDRPFVEAVLASLRLES